MFVYLVIAMCLCAVSTVGGVLLLALSSEEEARVVGAWNAVTCMLALVGLALCLAEVS